LGLYLPRLGGEFIEIADWIKDCFSQCDRLFRLPFHEPMSAFPVITDVGLTGGSATKRTLRALWGITAPVAQTVLLTFGLGLQQIPTQNSYRDWQFITFDCSAPDFPNLLKISDPKYRPVDFMPLCGRVVSNRVAFAEALRVGVPLVSLTPEDFEESALLLEGIADHSPSNS